MERHHLKKYANDSSSRLATKDDLNALTNIVTALVQSVADYVYEMSEHDEDTYDSRGELFEEDVDYTARGEDCYYIPMLEDEFANYYNPRPLQNKQERGVDHLRGQYFDNANSNLNFYPRQDDEEQEESSLAQLMTQMITTQTQMMITQAQQGTDLQLLTSELQQERAAQKLLETQLAQQASRSSQNPEKFPLQPDDEQLEQGNEKEVEEQETPYVAPSAYLPPIIFPHRQTKVPIKTIENNVVYACKLANDEREGLGDKYAKKSNTVGNNLNEVIKKSFHEAPEILICNTRLKDEPVMSLPGH